MDELIESCMQTEEEIEDGEPFKLIDQNCHNRHIGNFFMDERANNVKLDMNAYLTCFK